MTKKVLPRRRVNPAEMATEIRAELRGIFRRMDDLRRPMVPERIEGFRESEPRYALRQMAAHEAIQENVITLAGMVWHLKDRLKRWMSACQLTCSPGIEELALGNKPLLLCGDLIDSKKHGGGSNRSGFAPRVGNVGFLPSGPIALKYDGALKASDLQVSTADPVPYTVEIVSGDDRFTFGNAIDVICEAFRQWQIVIENSDFLGGGDGESVNLRHLFKRFQGGLTPIFKSDLISTQ